VRPLSAETVAVLRDLQRIAEEEDGKDEVVCPWCFLVGHIENLIDESAKS
jgi:hypothetical protein